MNDLETCREQILSEDTRDFISNPLRTPLFNELLKKDPCIQDAGLGYQCIYFSKELVEPISLARFSYNSIPNCFAPVAMETLNQTGILPVQNYPALQLKGKGVLIGFLDSGIDYQNKVFRNLDGEIIEIEKRLGISTQSSKVKPDTFSPTRISTVLRSFSDWIVLK